MLLHNACCIPHPYPPLAITPCPSLATNEVTRMKRRSNQWSDYTLPHTTILPQYNLLPTHLHHVHWFTQAVPLHTVFVKGVTCLACTSSSSTPSSHPSPLHLHTRQRRLHTRRCRCHHDKRSCTTVRSDPYCPWDPYRPLTRVGQIKTLPPPPPRLSSVQ